MSFHKKYDFSLVVNEKVRLVIDELEKQLQKRPEVCQCEECVLDMVTLALNKTKPSYRATLMGSIYAKVKDEENSVDIEQSVAVAIKRIFENPSHAHRGQ